MLNIDIKKPLSKRYKYRTFILGLKLQIETYHAETRSGQVLTKQDIQDIDKDIFVNVKLAMKQTMSLYASCLSKAQSSDDPNKQWSLTNENFHNTLRLFKEFEAFGASPKFAKYSSIVITLQFQSCAKLDEFMEKYARGDIQSLIQSTVVTKRFLNLLGLSRVDLQVSIADENYKKYHKEIKTGLFSF